jgi:bifunctional ADP-heptose synthase (sugar kinase/adenylyltransferase)
MKTKNIDKAIEYANKCATIVVQKQGVVTIW